MKDWNKLASWAIGFGLSCFAFRNPFMQLGLIIGAMGCVYVIIPNLINHKLTLGSKYIYIPILVIVGSIVASAFVRYSLDGDSYLLLSNSFMAVYFFGLYLVARLLGKEIFKPFAFAVIVEAVSVVIYGLAVNYGVQNGGLASIENYNIATGILVFGGIVSAWYKRWVIVTVSLIGLFFTGAEEAIIAVIILAIVVLLRKDFSKNLLIPVGSVAVIAVLGLFPFSYTSMLYGKPIERVLYVSGQEPQIPSIMPNPSVSPPSNNTVKDDSVFTKLDYALDGRLTFVKNAIADFKILGTGYVLYPNNAIDNPIHNVPLIIVEQTGIISAIAWVFLIIYCLKKLKMRYAFWAVIALAPFDNFMFTRIGLWVYVLIGVASVTLVKSDLIFKDNENTTGV